MFASRIINDLFLFSVLMPFVSPFPLGTDLQPTFLILGLLLIVVRFNQIRCSSANLITSIWLLLGVLGLVFYGESRLFFVLFSIFVMSLVYPVVDYSRLSRILRIIVLINIIVLMIQYYIGDLVNPLLEYVVRDIKVVDYSGARGATGLAAEPGFTGVLLVFYWLLLWRCRGLNEIGPSQFLFFSFLLFISLLFTKSGSGALFMLFALTGVLISGLRLNNLFLMFGVGILSYTVLYLIASSLESGGRFWQIFRVLLINPSSLFFLDSSIGHRMSNIVLGAYSLFDNPFGGRYYLDVLNDYPNDLLLNSFAGSKSNISAFAFLVTALGWFYFAPLLYLFFRSFVVNGRRTIPFLVLSLLMIMVSFSAAFPLVWFVIFSKRRFFKCVES